MASDIFLFPSAWESLSLALLEVMYIGKPCVVSLADGNKDVIHTGVNGYACGKKEDYIKAIRELLDDREMAKRLGRKAHSDPLWESFIPFIHLYFSPPMLHFLPIACISLHPHCK